MSLRRALATAPLLLAALVAGCAPVADTAGGPSASAVDPAASPSTSASADCTPAALRTLSPGALTVATSEPAYAPWVVDDDPTTGKGFEPAVAYAVAEQLGYSRDAVRWVRADFNAAIAPGPKSFDLDLNQFSITEERKSAVDFSSPYYEAPQAVVTTGGSPAAGATDLAALRGLRLGVQVGTTSYTAITDTIRPTAAPQVYNSNDDAVAALGNGQVDALVVDLPTAFYMASAQLDDGRVVGQLSSGAGGAGDSLGAVLDLGSPLTACVSRAVDTLRADGTLDSLAQQWLTEAGDAPVLR